MNMTKADNGMKNMMTMMMMSQMFNGNNNNDNYNFSNGNMNPMMFMMMGNNNMFDDMFNGAFDFGDNITTSVENETEEV